MDAGGKKLWWEDEGLRFECHACGRCCCGEPGDVWLSDEDFARIAEYLGADDETMSKRYVSRKIGRVRLREMENFDCVFYERNSAGCLIYKVRPKQCRLFPFWESTLKDKSVWNFYAKRCPGMNHGQLYTKEMISQFVDMSINDDLE